MLEKEVYSTVTQPAFLENVPLAAGGILRNLLATSTRILLFLTLDLINSHDQHEVSSWNNDFAKILSLSQLDHLIFQKIGFVMLPIAVSIITCNSGISLIAYRTAVRCGEYIHWRCKSK